MGTLFSILQSLRQDQYHQFGVFCLNHLLLPTLQTWVRKVKLTFQGWQSSAQSIKQALGMTTDLILDWISWKRKHKGDDVQSGLYLMLKQLLILLVECSLVPCENIARLSCSCIRHVIQTLGPSLSPAEWELVCVSVGRAVHLSLYHLHQLMALFHNGSENLYGDNGNVRVAARRDSTMKETNRLKQLAHQVQTTIKDDI